MSNIKIQINGKKLELPLAALYVGLPVGILLMFFAFSPSFRSIILMGMWFIYQATAFILSVGSLLIGPLGMMVYTNHVDTQAGKIPRWVQITSCLLVGIVIAAIVAFWATSITIPQNTLFFAINYILTNQMEAIDTEWRFQHFSYGWFGLLVIVNVLTYFGTSSMYNDNAQAENETNTITVTDGTTINSD